MPASLILIREQRQIVSGKQYLIAVSQPNRLPYGRVWVEGEFLENGTSFIWMGPRFWGLDSDADEIELIYEVLS